MPAPALAPAPAPFASSLEHLAGELARIEVLVRGQAERAREAAGDDAYRGLAITAAEVDAVLERAPGVPAWDGAPGTPLAEARTLAARMAEALAAREAASVPPPRLARLCARLS